ncbi:MAG: ACP phosphodiesterase [Flavobacteriaceae bacterium]|nr:ACP phosphodiesterase [Flavobacteriaceae bacterium]
MNYLAHSLFAFSDGQLVGQFLNDYIRNSERFSLPEEIQKGIKLHREIDTFTDSHPAIRQAKKVFSPLVRLYSGAFVDVAMDYFLANDSSVKSPKAWKIHSQNVYRILNENIRWFPENFQKMLSRMESDDWLYNYREDWAIKFSLQNVLNRAKYLEKDLNVFELFQKNKPALKKIYDEFFPELRCFCENYF